ncbi:hypothetical protein ACFV13_02210 [Streptomyces bauhiniae]|uniref:hypothetical protein n=1 Tax=Streptomyces bauhiniae TaxID=2340725 RepID=UPI0036C35B4D
MLSGAPDLAGVPEGLLALVTSALAKAPQERPTAAALAGRCTELLAAQSTHVLGAEPPTLAGDVMTAAWADLPPVEDDPAWAVARREATRRRTRLVAVAAVTGFAVAAAGTYLIAEYGRDGAPPSKAAGTPKGQEAKAPAPSATCLPVTYKTPGGQAGCESKKAICTAGSASYVKDINHLCGGPPDLRTVNVISQPSTGGDPSSVYCLAWTGSASAGSRDAVLHPRVPRHPPHLPGRPGLRHPRRRATPPVHLPHRTRGRLSHGAYSSAAVSFRASQVFWNSSIRRVASTTRTP